MNTGGMQMDTLLEKGSHKKGINGLPVPIVGNDEIIQRALIRLGVKKGSFVYDTELGSELHRLHFNGEESTQREAFSYVQEALRQIPEIVVEDVQCFWETADTFRLSITLSIQKNVYELELNY